MPVTWHFDNRIIVLDMRGEYGIDALQEALLGALDDTRCPSDAVLLFDMQHSESIRERSAEDVRAMARFLARHAARFGNRLAMLVGNDLAYGLMRVGAVHAEAAGVEPMVFRDADAARGWLLRSAAG